METQSLAYYRTS